MQRVFILAHPSSSTGGRCVVARLTGIAAETNTASRSGLRDEDRDFCSSSWLTPIVDLRRV